MKGHYRKALLALVSCLIFVFSSFAQFEVTVGETRDVSEETVLNFTLTDYNISSTTINNQVCDFINLSDASYFETKGMPMLPYISKSIIIPGDAAMGVEILNVTFKEIKVNKFLPSRGVIYRNQEPAAIPYSFDNFYSQDAWFPAQTVSLDKPYILRYMRGIVVRFYPFQYNPANGILKVAESISIKVKRIGAGKVNVLNIQNTGISPSFDTFYKNQFLNYQQIKKRYDFIEDGESMIILSPADFKSALEPLAKWKNQKGIKTTVYEYPSETGGSGSDNVKDFIESKFDSDNITYVLLVGDLDEMPCPSGGGGKSDPKYTQVSGSDNYPDLFVGRFSVSSSSDIQNMVNNALKYETEPDANGDWYNKAIGMASNEGNPADYKWMGDMRDVLLNYNYTEIDEVYQGQGATLEQVVDALNEGRGWFNYMGHGSSGSFGFSNASVKKDTWESLDNTGKLPVMISVACNNGQFDVSDCIAEVATLQDNKGAIAYLGSWISQPWNPPQYGQKEMVRLISIDKCMSLGGIVYNGTSKILDQSSYSSYTNTFLTWTLFGDPSIMVFTDKPEELNVTYPQAIETGDQDVDVSFGTSIDGRVCIYSEKDGILDSKILDAASSASLSVTVANDETKVILTVTGRNKIPFIKEIGTGVNPILNSQKINSSFDMRYNKSQLFYNIPNIDLKNSHVTIGLYDIHGKLVKKLVDESKGPGRYFVKLQNNGHQLASGIYLGKMEVADFRKTIKIIHK